MAEKRSRKVDSLNQLRQLRYEAAHGDAEVDRIIETAAAVTSRW